MIHICILTSSITTFTSSLHHLSLFLSHFFNLLLSFNPLSVSIRCITSTIFGFSLNNSSSSYPFLYSMKLDTRHPISSDPFRIRLVQHVEGVGDLCHVRSGIERLWQIKLTTFGNDRLWLRQKRIIFFITVNMLVLLLTTWLLSSRVPSPNDFSPLLELWIRWVLLPMPSRIALL